jgi:hypothetical protein
MMIYVIIISWIEINFEAETFVNYSASFTMLFQIHRTMNTEKLHTLKNMITMRTGAAMVNIIRRPLRTANCSIRSGASSVNVVRGCMFSVSDAAGRLLL